MLIKEELLKYCKYYHNEVISPYTDSDSTLIWMAEKFLCNDGTNLVNEKDIKNSIYDIVFSYVGKWNPYEVRKIMSRY